MTASILVIAGSDPSGGAGVQSDRRVIESAGFVCASVVTAETVQDSSGVDRIVPSDIALFREQLVKLLDDLVDLRAVKIGMLATKQHVEVVAEALTRHRPPNIVIDPVLASTNGVPLLAADAIELMKAILFPLAALVTPNLPELELLATGNDLRSRATQLLETGVRAILVKGGHADAAELVDVLFDDEVSAAFPTQRIDTVHTHGTGCYLSSAIAANLALGKSLPDAINRAKSSLTAALQHPATPGRHRGFPVPVALDAGRRGDSIRGVYVITDATMGSRSHLDIAREVLDADVSLVQLRDKRSSTDHLIATATRLRELTQSAGALLIINDRVDVCLASEADGVHLGPGDMLPFHARRILGEKAIIGVSVNSVAEARAAAPFATYFGVGAIFGTNTKSDAGDAIGLEPIRVIKQQFPDHPIVAIGGINLQNIADVARAGADAAAVISAVTAADDMRAAAAALIQAWNATR